MDGRSSIPVRATVIFLHHSIQTASGSHPISYPMGTGGAVSIRVKQFGREAGHSLQSIAEVKNGGAIPPLPLMSSLHRDNFIFTCHLGCDGMYSGRITRMFRRKALPLSSGSKCKLSK
jgi:hypothetical protein